MFLLPVAMAAAALAAAIQPQTAPPALAVEAGADPGDPDDASLGETPTEAAAAAWVKAKLQLPGWTYIGAMPLGVMFTPDQMAPSGGRVVAPVRIEQFKPGTTDDGVVYRSMKVTLEVDCAHKSYVARNYTIYAGHGLQRELASADEPEGAKPRPVKPDDLAPLSLLKACGPSEGPASLDEAAVRPWIARTVQPGRDAFAYYDEGAAWYLRGALTRDPAGRVSFVGRGELFEPDAGARSRTMRVELDCEGRRLRVSEGRSYPQHNLHGDVVVEDLPADWMAPHDGATSLQFDRFCTMVGAAGGEGW